MSEMSPGETPESLATEQRRNQKSRDAWELFAEHRAIVTGHLSRAGSQPPTKRLCVLGAGNCNDLDLHTLGDHYAAIDLIDWDASALEFAVARQSIQEPSRVSCFTGIDLGGLSASLARIVGGRPTDASIAELAKTAENAEISLPGTGYDVVASLALLSQLIDQVVRLAPEAPERLLEVFLAVRRRHIQLMLDLLRPGGLFLLVTDFVSSDTCPELLTIPPVALPDAANRWLAERNFFSGLNPRAILQDLLTHERFAGRIAEAQLVRPWRWQLSARRAFAVCAMKAIKRA